MASDIIVVLYRNYNWHRWTGSASE